MKTKMKLSPTVAALLTLDEVSLHHRVELNPEQAIEFAQHAKPHSEPDGTLLAFVTAVNDAVPVMNFAKKGDINNPNNGKTHHRFEIGKEYKRVVYINIVTCYFSGAAIGSKPEGAAAQKVQALIDELENQARIHGAGEVSTVQDELSFAIRVCFNR